MNTKLKFVLDVDVRVKKHIHKIHYCECKVPFLHRVWSTYRRSRQSREASLSTLTWQTHNTTRSNQTLRTWGTFRTLQSWDVKFRFTQDTKLKQSVNDTVVRSAHRWSIFSRLSLLSLLTRRSTQPSVSLSSWRSSITTSTLWSVFARRTRRTNGARVALWCQKLAFILTFDWKNQWSNLFHDTHVRARRSHSASSTRETSSTL